MVVGIGQVAIPSYVALIVLRFFLGVSLQGIFLVAYVMGKWKERTGGGREGTVLAGLKSEESGKNRKKKINEKKVGEIKR